MAIFLIFFQRLMIGLVAKISLLVFGNNKGADQPAHSHSLISAFVFVYRKVSCVDFLYAKFQFVAEQAGLNITLSETKKTGFLASRPNWYLFITYLFL